MAYEDLREWIRALEKHGELKRIREEVSPELEITEITDRVSKIGAHGDSPVQKKGAPKYAPGGPALIFENVKGHPGHKVLINQFGSERRMALALGVDRLDEIADRITGLMNVKAPEGLFDKLKMLPQLGALTSAFPRAHRACASSGRLRMAAQRSSMVDVDVSAGIKGLSRGGWSRQLPRPTVAP